MLRPALRAALPPLQPMPTCNAPHPSRQAPSQSMRQIPIRVLETQVVYVPPRPPPALPSLRSLAPSRNIPAEKGIHPLYFRCPSRPTLTCSTSNADTIPEKENQHLESPKTQQKIHIDQALTMTILQEFNIAANSLQQPCTRQQLFDHVRKKLACRRSKKLEELKKERRLAKQRANETGTHDLQSMDTKYNQEETFVQQEFEHQQERLRIALQAEFERCKVRYNNTRSRRQHDSTALLPIINALKSPNCKLFLPSMETVSASMNQLHQLEQAAGGTVKCLELLSVLNTKICVSTIDTLISAIAHYRRAQFAPNK